LQAGRVVGGGEPVGQLGERDAGVRGRALGVFVSVQPHFHRIREVCANLDERRTEDLVDQIEVIGGHPPVGLGVAEVRGAAAVGVVGGAGERPLELLRHPDRGHPTASFAGQSVQVRAHHLQLPVAPGEPHPRDAVGLRVRLDRAAEPGAVAFQQRRRRDREPPVRQKVHTWPPTCRFGT
jgi:hypothetical protein